LDIEGWLRGIGLDQYAEMFRTNDIDFQLLGRLTNDDLKDIGVFSFGHPKKLLEAIAKLGSAPLRSAKAPPPAFGASRLHEHAARTAGRIKNDSVLRFDDIDNGLHD
jgi:SAM domain (Sterile alpha motif)